MNRDPGVQPRLEDVYGFRSSFFETPAGRMHYLDEGSGPVVLCLHGNPTWSFYYRRVVRHLMPRCRVVVPDHIGCGLSDKPQGWSYEIADHIANLRGLIEHLDLRDITLVVHDWGGPIGFGNAGSDPDRFRAFVVLNTAAFFVPRLPWRIAACRIPLLGALMVRGFNAFAEAATVMTTQRPLDEFTKECYVAPYDSWSNRVATLRFVEDIPMSVSHPSWKTIEKIDAGLAGLAGKPMLIGWGMKDFCFTPRFLEEWRRRFPGAEVELYEDAGHYVLEDAHERLLPRIERFLESHGILAAG